VFGARAAAARSKFAGATAREKHSTVGRARTLLVALQGRHAVYIPSRRGAEAGDAAALVAARACDAPARRCIFVSLPPL
jgi:hypothetical protein